MKAIIIILLMAAMSAFAQSKDFNVDNPPFYTMTFEEISRFNQPNQDVESMKARNAYFSALFHRVSKLKSSASHPIQHFNSVRNLERLSYSDDLWNKFRADVFYACQERIENQGCQDLLAYRLKIFKSLSPLHK